MYNYILETVMLIQPSISADKGQPMFHLARGVHIMVFCVVFTLTYGLLPDIESAAVRN